MAFQVHKRCRLCFALKPGTVSIFQYVKSGKKSNNKIKHSLQILKMFQIEIIETPTLPNICCADCSKFLLDIMTFNETAVSTQSSLMKSMKTKAKSKGADGSEVTSLCRLCKGASSTGSTNIFLNFAYGQTYSSLIEEWLKIELQDLPGLPQTCCSTCITFLHKINSFRTEISSTHASFMTAIEMQSDFDDSDSDEEPAMLTQFFVKSEINTDDIKPSECLPEITEEITENNNEEEEFGYDDNNLDNLDNSSTLEEADAKEESSIKPELNQFQVDEQPKWRLRTKAKSSMSKPEVENGAVTDGTKKHKRFRCSYDELRQRKQEEEHLEGVIRDMGVLKCSVCQQNEKTFASLYVHMKAKHKKVAGITCCDKFHKGHTLSFDHIRFHLNKDSFKCDACNKQCINRLQLIAHKKYAHSTTNAVCNLCGKSFSNDILLKLHARAHITKEEYKVECKYCQKKYKDNIALKRHLERVHENTQQFKCPACSKGFSSQSLLNQHISVHRKNADGTIVVRRFGEKRKPTEKSEPREKKEPKKKKGELKLQECNICFKYFIHLDHHKRYTHKEVKQKPRNTTWEEGKVVCDKCGKYSLNVIQLKIHKTRCGRDTGRESVPCSICFKVFNGGRSLSKHMETHKLKPEYDCPFCPTKTRSKGHLVLHFKFKHKEEYENMGKGSNFSEILELAASSQSAS